jgi:hypothetical protein
MRRYAGADDGYRQKVLRMLSVAALVALVAAGCGSAGPRPRAERGLPRALASAWASRASTIASAAGAGENCRASQLASSLRDEIIAKEGRVPVRLRKPLVQGANALADRITCTVTVAPAPKRAPKPPGQKPPKPPHDKKHGGPGGNQQ